MRCRRVRSFLSAYCNGELSGTRQRAVVHHLDSCPECRREEQIYRELALAKDKLERPTVSSDFNTRLLNRIAEERYQETRKKAYMPKEAPAFGMRTIVSVSAMACLVLAFVFAGGLSPFMTPDKAPVMAGAETALDAGMDDRYLTVQPSPDHVLAQHVDQQWEFNRQMGRATRIRNYMNQLAGSNNDFGNIGRLPFQGGFILIQQNGQTFIAPLGQPVIRNYITPQTDAVREVQETF